MQNKQQKNATDNAEQVVMFHDGDCPLCKFEVKAMQKLDTANAIRWVDITKDKDALDKAGITYQQAMDRIHVQNEEKQLLTGVRGFITVWKHLPYYRRLVPVITRVPLLLPIMEFFYSQFAKHRLLLTGKKRIFAKRASKPEA